MENIVKGDDKNLYLRIRQLESGDGVILDYDGFSTDPNIKLTFLKFFLFYKDKTLIKSFGIQFFSGSTSGIADFGAIQILDANKGTIKVRVDSIDSIALNTGYYFGRAEMTINNNGVNEIISLPDYGKLIGNIIYPEQ